LPRMFFYYKRLKQKKQALVLQTPASIWFIM
jgi:hypothetical protein